MRWSKVWLTIKKELRAIVRDKKSFLIILLSPFIVPAFVLGMSTLYEMMLTEEVEYSIGVNYEFNSNEKSIVNELDLDVKKYKSLDEMKEAYDNGDIVAYVNLDKDIYNIYANIDDVDGGQAVMYIEAYLNAYNDYLAENYLLSEDIEPSQVFGIVKHEIHKLEGDNYLVSILLSIALPYVIMVLTMAATSCATDLTAGEKEKGTLETLLTFPIKSKDIIFGKFFAITITCILSGLFSFFLALISLNISVSVFDLFDGVVFNISALKIVMGVLIIISSSLIVAGLAIALASRAKTFKEAQSATNPLQFLVMAPIILEVAEVENSFVLSIIPVIGQSMLLNDLFSGSVNLLNVLAMFVSSIIFIVILITIISKQYKSEKVLFF